MVNHRPLNANQRLFVKEYLSSRNATDAYHKTYKCTRETADANGPKLLGDTRIKELIDLELAKLEAKTGVTAEWVVNGLKTVAQRCLQEKRVMEFDHIDKMMKPKLDEDTGEPLFEFDASGANRSLELLGKHLGIFTEKTEHLFPQLDEVRSIFGKNEVNQQ